MDIQQAKHPGLTCPQCGVRDHCCDHCYHNKRRATSEPCCISFCNEAATHRAGRDVYFPLCDVHYEQLT